MSANDKQTSISFSYMKSYHYPRFLYRDTELPPNEVKPRLFVTKDEHPELFRHMRILDVVDLKIPNVFTVQLKTAYESIPEKWNIVYYVGNNKDYEERYADNVSTSGISTRDLIEVIVTNITNAEKQAA